MRLPRTLAKLIRVDPGRLDSDALARLHRAVDHIEHHLERGVELAELARVAGYSPFHFHRVFSAWSGETVTRYAARLRLERAAARLLDRPDESITRVAAASGYASPATFARAFRAHFGRSATQWRSDAAGRRSNAPRGAFAGPGPELGRVRIRSWPRCEIAYLRHVGAYAGDADLFGELFARLVRRAREAGLVDAHPRWLCVYHDPPGVTPAERLRVSAGLTLSAEATLAGTGLGRLALPASRWAVGACERAPDEYAGAWDALFAQWLPARRLRARPGPALEIYPPGEARRAGARRVEICVPVEPRIAS